MITLLSGRKDPRNLPLLDSSTETKTEFQLPNKSIIQNKMEFPNIQDPTIQVFFNNLNPQSITNGQNLSTLMEVSSLWCLHQSGPRVPQTGSQDNPQDLLIRGGLRFLELEEEGVLA